MGGYKAPCIYINDKTTIGKTVVEVPTAIPVFIGCKEKAGSGNDDPKGIPWKISSMTELRWNAEDEL